MALALHPTQERVVLHGVTWATFERLLADRGDQRVGYLANPTYAGHHRSCTRCRRLPGHWA